MTQPCTPDPTNAQRSGIRSGDWLGCSFSALELLRATKTRHDKLALVIMLKNLCIRREDWLTASRFRNMEKRMRDRLCGRQPNGES